MEEIKDTLEFNERILIMTNLNLTTEEKALIEAEEKEKLLKNVKHFKEKQNIYKNKVMEFWADFDQKYYSLTTQTLNQEFNAYNFVSNGKNEIIAEETVPYKVYRIVHNEHSKIYVEIKESNNHGYHLYVNGIGYDISEKPYKKPATIIRKVNEYLETQNYLNERSRLEDECLNELKEKYPEASIGKHGTGNNSKYVSVKFPNDLRVEYSFGYDGVNLRTFIKNINHTSLDNNKVIEALKNLEKKENA